MHPIHLPFRDRDLKVRQIDAQKEIWDICRKKYISLTPEEWVRQHVVHMLIEDFHIPKGLISIERRVGLGKSLKRYDIVVYDRDLRPFLLVECKSPDVMISEDTLKQISMYQRTLRSVHLLITNGTYSFLASVSDAGVEWVSKMPLYPID